MSAGKIAERMMAMNDAVWLRHANPLSGWTRLATGPVLFWAIWSHRWIGWFAIIPVAILAVWIWFNPRIFAKPKRADAWMTKGVLGERVWLNRAHAPIPPGFVRAAWLLNTAAGLGVAFAVAGFVIGDFWLAFLAWHFAMAMKLWFVDRMVWLWERMKDSAADYRDWEEALSG